MNGAAVGPEARAPRAAGTPAGRWMGAGGRGHGRVAAAGGRGPGPRAGGGAAREDAALLGALLAARAANALLLRTAFAPDEYWQALEPAHRLAFGRGALTWDFRARIRGWLCPTVFAGAYRLAALLGGGLQASAVLAAPRLLQGALAGVGDFYVYLLSRRLMGAEVARWALVCQIMSWFNFFCAPRTLANSTEAVLSVAALYHWPRFGKAGPYPRGGDEEGGAPALVLGMLACVVRPSGAPLWLAMGALELLRRRRPLKWLLQRVLPLALLVGSSSVLLDSWAYWRVGADARGGLPGISERGQWEWVVAPWNFFRVNVLEGVSANYGTHPCHWYFTQGFPVVAGTFLPIMILGLYGRWRQGAHLPALALWSVCYHSFIGHKEFRFALLPLQLLMPFAGAYLSALGGDAVARAKKGTTTPRNRAFPWRHWVMAAVFAPQVLAGAYFSFVHQRGGLDVMDRLRAGAAAGTVREVLFLTPCHVLPFYSHMHWDVAMHFLDCSPQLRSATDQPTEAYKNEEGVFKSDPPAYLRARYGGQEAVLPSHIVLFAEQVGQVLPFLDERGYRLAHTAFHAHVPADAEYESSGAARVVVFSKSGTL